MAMKGDLSQLGLRSLKEDPLKTVEERLARLMNGKGKERTDTLRREMQSLMMEFGSVFREEKGLEKGIEKIRDLKGRYMDVVVVNQGKAFNYDRVEAIELGHQLDLAEVILFSALHRKESRGGHFREDYSARDDQNYLKHTLVFKTTKGLEVRYKPVKITRFQPEARVY